MKHTPNILVVLVLLIGINCSQKAVGQKLDSPKAFKAFLENNSNAQLIDIRTEEEVERGKIEGSVNFDFYKEDFQNRMQSLDKTRPVMVYCAAGGRSAKAAKMLSDMGFLDVHDLDGGINAWVNAGFPLKN